MRQRGVSFWEYPQTWAWVERLPRSWVTRIQRWCGHITGHAWSRTECGYGGGRFFDVWCRWCDYESQIPVEEMPSRSGLIDRYRSFHP